MLLEEIYQKTFSIEKEFTKKKILFIPCESYDDPTITIIEGLNKLGFEILVHKKFNINSWFCNKIIENLDNIEDEIDFVLSNLHWGTQWSLYKKLSHKVPFILIDGEDRLHDWSKHPNWKRSSWRDTIECREKKYKRNPPEHIKNLELSPYRWVEDLGNYNPDIVFKSQKYLINTNSIYLPFSVKEHYKKYNKNKNLEKRKIDICHIGGNCGEYREIMAKHLDQYKLNSKYNIFNGIVYGDNNSDIKIKKYIDNDKNIHSWHRWRCCDKYYETLNNSKILINHGLDKYWAPGWDSKRLWEALSQGCFVLYQKQVDFDNSQYPIKEICDYSEYKFDNMKDLNNKLEYLLENKKELEKKTKNIVDNANKYFNSITITRYFLWNISNKINT